VSLLSPESLTVYIAPGEVIAVRRTGLRQTIADKRIVPVKGHPENSGEGWEGAAQAFAELLLDLGPCRRVHVVLSNHFVHYQLLPWRDDIKDRDEEIALAQMAFTQTYGEVATHWQLRVDDEAPGRSRISAAVSADFLATLEKLAAACKSRIVSLQPYLSAALNHWRGMLNGKDATWFVLHEDGRLCLAYREAGSWRWLRALRVGSDWCERLPDLLDDEALLAGTSAAPAAMIFAPACQELAVPAGSRWSLRALRLAAAANFSPISDGRFGPALVE